jgi:nicotinate phosphoribosyltransferase
MPGSVPPPPPLVTSALALGLEAFVAVRAAVVAGVADARASFELTLASPSPDWGFAVLAGLEPLIDALERLRMKVDELDWLGSVGAIDAATRRRLADLRFACDVDAPPEGSVVFPGEAVVVVEGPFWQAQLVGGLALAAITDATAVATRFARLTLASGGAELVEDGSAISHRLGGTPSLARAAYVGGAGATTSALAGRRYGIPVTAVQPVRFDLAAGDADRAARAWLASAPDGCVLRVDPTNARAALARLARAVRERARSAGARWDPRRVALELAAGDRLGLAREATRAFAEEGLASPPLLVSGHVDERMLLELRAEGAPVQAFAVRAGAMPHVDPRGSYDMVAIEDEAVWSPRMRLGSDVASSGDPGRKLLVRYTDADGHPVADVAHSTNERFLRAQGGRFIDRETGLETRLSASASAPLRGAAMRAGKRAISPEPVAALRDRAREAVQALGEEHRRIASPARYRVGVSLQLASLKTELLARAAAAG